jgi:hypothetical protein
MTEAEWLTDAEWLMRNQPEIMLQHLMYSDLSTVLDRKLRLYACACTRQVWDALTDSRSRTAIEVAEQFADECASDEQLEQAYSAADDAWKEREEAIDQIAPPVISFLAAAAFTAANDIRHTAIIGSRYLAGTELGVGSELALETNKQWSAQILLICDIFGNPFRPITFNPAWLTSTVLALAHAIYQEKAFDRMPILADALQDAGCDNEEILSHCRQPGEHVRGCWVVDLLLAKQ